MSKALILVIKNRSMDAIYYLSNYKKSLSSSQVTEQDTLDTIIGACLIYGGRSREASSLLKSLQYKNSQSPDLLKICQPFEERQQTKQRLQEIWGEYTETKHSQQKQKKYFDYLKEIKPLINRDRLNQYKMESGQRIQRYNQIQSLYKKFQYSQAYQEVLQSVRELKNQQVQCPKLLYQLQLECLYRLKNQNFETTFLMFLDRFYDSLFQEKGSQVTFHILEIKSWSFLSDRIKRALLIEFLNIRQYNSEQYDSYLGELLQLEWLCDQKRTSIKRSNCFLLPFNFNLDLVMNLIDLEENTFMGVNMKSRIYGILQIHIFPNKSFSTMHRKAWNLNKKKLGSSHKLTLTRAKDLAISLMLSRKFTEAKKVINLSIRQAKRSLGKKSFFTLRLYEFYGICLKQEKKFERALKNFEKVRKVREQVQGFTHRDTIICSFLKSKILYDLQMKQESIKVLLQLRQYSKISLTKVDSLPKYIEEYIGKIIRENSLVYNGLLGETRKVLKNKSLRIIQSFYFWGLIQIDGKYTDQPDELVIIAKLLKEGLKRELES